MLSSRPAPACCTSWCSPKCAASASDALSPGAQLSSFGGRGHRGRASPRPLLHRFQLPCSRPSQPSPLSQSTLLLPAWQPRLPPLSRGARRPDTNRDPAPRSAAGCTPSVCVEWGLWCRCLHNFLLGSGIPSSAGSATHSLQTLVARGGAVNAGPGRG
jgi:hypothetical protein